MTDTKELRKLAEECLVDQPNLQLMELRAKTVIALLDTIEAQAAEIAARGNAVLVPSDKLKELQAKLEAQAALLMQCRDTLVEVMYSNCTDVAREKYMATIAALNEFEKGTE
jgi:hypothetical protein